MDQKKNLILLKGEDKTLKVQSCHYNSKTEKYEVSFGGDRIYTYNQDSVEWMQHPRALNPAMYQISHEGKGLTHIVLLLEFIGVEKYHSPSVRPRRIGCCPILIAWASRFPSLQKGLGVPAKERRSGLFRWIPERPLHLFALGRAFCASPLPHNKIFPPE